MVVAAQPDQANATPVSEAADDANRFLEENLDPAGGYFVQITDTHIGGGAEEDPPEGLFADRKPSEHLRQLLSHLRSLDPAPDFLLITGDLSDHGTAGELSSFRDIVAEEWPLPVHFVRGNHDRDLNAFLEAMSDQAEFDAARMAEAGYCYAFDYRGVRVVCLDSETYRDGSSQARWLEDEIAGLGVTPLLAASHRHLLPTGHGLVDHWGGATVQTDAEALMATLKGAPRLLPFLCGHVHYTCGVRQDSFLQLCLTSSFYAVEDLGDLTGPLRARLCHVRDGELLWTAITDAQRDTAIEWSAAAEELEAVSAAG